MATKQRDEPLGSVVVTSTPAVCGACRSSRTTVLGMTLTDGTEVTFVSCRECEHRAWVGPDGELAVDEVLQRTRKQ